MCWHLSGALHWRGRAALLAVSLAGGLAASAGLLFSGSRGPWLGALTAVPAGLIVIAVRRRETRRTALVLALAATGLAAASWPWTGHFVRLRAGQALEQVQAAIGPEAEYDSDVGRRIEWWGMSARVVAAHPLGGTGGGAFDDEVAAMGRTDLGQREHHAHSLYLHEAATLGLPGLALALVVLGLTAWRAWRTPPVQPYADGTFFVLVGWLIGAVFDCYQLNGTMSGLFGMIALIVLAPHAESEDAWSPS